MALQSTSDWIEKLKSEDPAVRGAAEDALAKKGAPELRKAVEKAGGDVRPRLEDALLRALAKTDASSAAFDKTELSITDASMVQEPGPDGKTALRVKAVFSGTNAGTAPVPITITRALFLSAKGELSMVVRGAKDEPFTRQYDPNVPKLFEYGAILPPRWPPGTRALVVFDLESGGVKKSIRTLIQTVSK